MPIAFKEWAVTVRALAEGEQLVTLRKGGIREPEKHFALEHDRFFLYPTFDHQRRRSRPRVAPARDAARARGGRVGRRRAAAHALTVDGGHPAARPRADPRLGRGRRARGRSPTGASSTRCRRSTSGRPDYAEKRLAWKRRHPLHVLLLRTYRIPRPVTVKVRDDYGGCRSWLEITRDLPFEGTPGALRRGVRAGLRGDRRDRRVARSARLRLTFREPAHRPKEAASPRRVWDADDANRLDQPPDVPAGERDPAPRLALSAPGDRRGRASVATRGRRATMRP